MEKTIAILQEEAFKRGYMKAFDVLLEAIEGAIRQATEQTQIPDYEEEANDNTEVSQG